MTTIEQINGKVQASFQNEFAGYEISKIKLLFCTISQKYTHANVLSGNTWYWCKLTKINTVKANSWRIETANE